ncbi:hypothetical protein [Phaeovulum sp. NW3]|uniref:hypothetical protein n=1 Tax=Phaeovulum sp. NW3 TaxID=2934933 RepID=UPI0020206F47|nr:hypothetical protein [Phaeovulum sp. NW3]MCL7464363.1 hypothetical protein [Phaeovulum sp. NW3]
MVGASKILTVSYGTFSCTLEGFDEPFSTMKAIAEYFRDLAAEDRYFGAEPPTPDAEMLHRIAEREIQRRVEAKIQANGIVLRPQADAAADEPIVAAPAPAPMPEPTAEQPAAPLAEAAPITLAATAQATDLAADPGGPESVAAKLQRIRAAVASARSAAQVYAEDEGAEPLLPPVADNAPEDFGYELDLSGPLLSDEDDTPAPMAAEAIAEDAPVPEEPAATEAVAAPAEAQAEPLVPLSDEAAARRRARRQAARAAALAAAAAELRQADAGAEPETDPGAPEAEEAQDEAPAPIDIALPKVEIAAVAEDAADATEKQNEEVLAAAPPAGRIFVLHPTGRVDVVAADEATEELAAPDETGLDDAALLSLDDEAATDAECIPVVDALDAEEQETVDLDDDLAESVLAALAAEDDTEAGADADVAVAPDTAEPIGAEDDAEDLAEETAEAAQDIAQDEIVTDAELTDQTADALIDDAALTADGLSPEAEAELLNELAALETDEPEPGLEEVTDQPDEAAPQFTDETAEATAAEPEAAADTQAARSHGADHPVATPPEEADLSRLLEETNTKLEGAENRRRFSAIAHLKAAVAATVADRLLRGTLVGKSAASRTDDTNAYREDLSQAVRPRRPVPAGQPQTARPQLARPEAARPARPENRPAPLVLVSEQRVDRSADRVVPATPVVRPRRVSAGQIGGRRAAAGAPDAGADDAPAGRPDPVEARSFAEFAQEAGSNGLADLLEAAAAYTATVEGRPHFSPPQIMKQVATVADESAFSREDRLRSFGQLLRQGKIAKVKRGQYAITEQSRFYDETNRAAN